LQVFGKRSLDGLSVVRRPFFGGAMSLLLCLTIVSRPVALQEPLPMDHTRPPGLEWPVSAPSSWEKTSAVSALYKKLISAGDAWDAGAQGRLSAGAAKKKIVRDLMSVASSSNTLAIAAAARRWYREGRSPYYVLLNLLEPLVFLPPKIPAFASNPYTPWKVAGNRLFLGDNYDPEPITFTSGPSPKWKVICGPFDSTRADLRRFIAKVK
jgi:hypothetical protein